MEPVGVSGTMAISDQKTYVNIETLGGKIPQKSGCVEWNLWWVHRGPVYGFSLGKSFSWWLWRHRQWSTIRKTENINRFKEVWSLWQILLKKIVVQHVRNFLEPREQNIRRKMQKNRPQLLVAGPLVLHDNACLHIADVGIKKTSRLWVGRVTSWPYNPDISPQDFDLFPKLIEPMSGRWTFLFSGWAFYRQYLRYSTCE